MQATDLITNTQAVIINTLSNACAGAGILAGLLITIAIVVFWRNDPRSIRQAFAALPTRMLYAALLLSMLYSACWIISCTRASRDPTTCSIAMFGIVSTIHVINGLCLTILLHCGLLLSSQNPRMSSMVVKTAIILVILASVALASAGLVSERFGYIEAQDTCWITSKHDDPLSAYKSQAILLYGPIFACVLCNFIAVAYILVELRRLRASNRIGSKRIRSLILRMAFSPIFLLFHCLMVIGGDLPITYHTTTGQITSYLANYLGFSCYSLALSLCAVFLDPAFRNMQASFRSCAPNQSSEGETPEGIRCDEVSGPRNDCEGAEEITEEKHLYATRSSIEIGDGDKLFHAGPSLEGQKPSTPEHGKTFEVEIEEVKDEPNTTDMITTKKSKEHVCTPDGDCCIFIV